MITECGDHESFSSVITECGDREYDQNGAAEMFNEMARGLIRIVF